MLALFFVGFQRRDPLGIKGVLGLDLLWGLYQTTASWVKELSAPWYFY